MGEDNILEGELYHNLAALFATLVKTKVIITGDHFKSTLDEQCVKCSVKAQEGLLYPLVKSILFIHKPVVYIKHDEIKQIRFTRLELSKRKTVRTFDLLVVCKSSQSNYEFTGIRTDEFDRLKEYFTKVGIQIVAEEISEIGAEKGAMQAYDDYDDDDSDDEEYVEGQSQGEGDDDDDDDDEEFDGKED